MSCLSFFKLFVFFSFLMFWLCLTTGCEQSDKEIPGPKIYLDMPTGGFEMEVNDTLVLEPKIIYDYNSSYQWVENGTVISEGRDLVLAPSRHETRNLVFKIDNPQGRDEIDVTVHVIVLSDFEKFNLSSNSVLYNSADTVEFKDRIMFYPNQADVAAKNWNGFAFSNRLSSTKNDSTTIFHVNASTGGSKSKNFAIYHYQPNVTNHIRFTDGRLHHLKSIEVCNNLFTAQVVKYGFEKTGIPKFEKGDWIILSVEAYDAQGALIGSKNEVLVDYRFDNPSKYVIVSSWKTMDLSLLENVATVDLIVKSSRIDAPTYVCIDNFKLIN